MLSAPVPWARTFAATVPIRGLRARTAGSRRGTAPGAGGYGMSPYGGFSGPVALGPYASYGNPMAAAPGAFGAPGGAYAAQGPSYWYGR